MFFFNLFNSLLQSKKQIVITSDRPPAELKTLEKRLRSRFSSGVVIDIQPPDRETREVILRNDRDALAVGDRISDEIIQRIAEKIDTNVRELKAVFRQVLALSDVTGEPVSLEAADQAIDKARRREE